jgi:hypothetical protein
MAAFRSLFALLALLSVKVLADCVSYGIDYANGGSYYIDASSSQYFTFITVFQGMSFVRWTVVPSAGVSV